MRVGVTGAGGTVGRSLIPALRLAGHRVVALTRGDAPIPQADYTVTHWMNDRPSTPPLQDLASWSNLVETLEGVVHLAGTMTPTTSREFDQAHLAPVQRLVDQLAPSAAFVAFSAANADAASSNGYARSKGEAELLAAQNFPASWVLRPDLILHPPTQPSSFESAIVERLPDRPAVVLGPSDRRIRPIGIADVCVAVLACLAGQVPPGTYALSGPQEITMFDLVQALSRAVVAPSDRPAGGPVPVPVLGLRPEHRDRRPDLPAPILEYFEAWKDGPGTCAQPFPFPGRILSPVEAWHQLVGAPA
ncbi:MAG: epimerase [Nocardioides sp.]|nr:epimerase [Nocardioides sp.]